MASVVFAVGDIAGKPGDNPGAPKTGALINQLLTAEPTATVLMVGDGAYLDGTLEEYRNFYTPTWGGIQVLARTRACPGNHEYHTAARGYFQYFGARAGPNTKGWYSFDLGDWHVVSLNTERDVRRNSPQLQWLATDLQNRQQPRVLAFFHRQRFGSGGHGDELSPTEALWTELSRHKTEIVVNGHAHHYERFAPQRPDQTADPAGIREFIVGTGGREFAGRSKNTRNSEVANFNSFGVLRLDLDTTKYAWKFIPVAGSTFTDSGTWPTNH